MPLNHLRMLRWTAVVAVAAVGKRSLSSYLAHSLLFAPVLAAWGLGRFRDGGRRHWSPIPRRWGGGHARDALRTKSVPVIPSTRTAWPRWWASALAWGLWALALLDLAATAWLDQLLRQAGLPHLSTGTGNAVPAGAAVVAATVGALVASRPPRHPVGCCWPSDSR